MWCLSIRRTSGECKIDEQMSEAKVTMLTAPNHRKQKQVRYLLEVQIFC